MSAREILGKIVSYKVINGDNEYQAAYSASSPGWTAKTAYEWAKATADHHIVKGRIIGVSVDGEEKVIYSNRYVARTRKKDS